VPRLAARAREAFIAMDMPALAAEAAQFSQGVTVPARSANRPI
jgi:hypothetical protein